MTTQDNIGATAVQSPVVKHDGMSDSTLARYMRSLQSVPLVKRDDAWLEMLLLAENEVCGRAGIPLDETEQGLTPTAVVAINAWVSAQVKP